MTYKVNGQALSDILATNADLAAVPEAGVFAHGDNQYNQLQPTNEIYISDTRKIGEFSPTSKMYRTSMHTAIIDSNRLFIGGYNISGEYGNNTTTNKSNFVQVGTDANWGDVVIDVYKLLGAVIALKTDGSLWSWGANVYGQLGLGNRTDRSSPVQVGSLTNWSKIAAANSGAVAAIKTDGTLWTWGNNVIGELGINSTAVARSSPVQVGTLTNWSKIAGGGRAFFAIKTDGTLWAWGNNGNGQLGTGNVVHRPSPVQVGSLTDWAVVAPGSNYVHAIKTDGTLWAWGANVFGQLGLGDALDRSSPTQVGTLTNWASIEPVYARFAKTDGTLWEIQNASPVQVGTANSWTSPYTKEA